jgi:dihydroxyacetone kinase
MKKGAERVLVDVGDYSEDGAAFCDGLASSIGSAMGGTSGALLELFFRAAANSLSENSAGKAGFHRVVEALAAGSNSMMFYGGATAGMRTMLDALLPAVEQLKSSIEPENESALLVQMEQQLKVRAGSDNVPNVADGDARAMSTAVCVALASVKAREGCEATKTMKALAGRSNYVNEELMMGHPDPGALAVAAMFEVFARVLYSDIGKP